MIVNEIENDFVIVLEDGDLLDGNLLYPLQENLNFELINYSNGIAIMYCNTNDLCYYITETMTNNILDGNKIILHGTKPSKYEELLLTIHEEENDE